MDLTATFGDGSGLVAELQRYLVENGLQSLLAGFDGAGAEEEAESWVGDGANRPVEVGHVQRAMGRDALSEIASRLGTDPDTAAAGLARIIPAAVDAITPGGHLPTGAQLDALDLATELTGTDVGGLLGADVER